VSTARFARRLSDGFGLHGDVPRRPLADAYTFGASRTSPLAITLCACSMKTLCTLFPLVVLVFAGGCATIRVTDPKQTATEQFLMSQAVSRSLEQLNVDALRDRKIWLETGYFTGAEQVVVNGEVRQRLFTTPEQAFAAAELRERLLLGGARIVQDKKEAEVIVEMRSGGIGIDRLENLIGVPATVLGGVVGGTTAGIPVSIPEIALYKNTRQRGFASVSFVAYRADTGEYLTSSGPYVGRTIRDDFWLFGAGPRTVGNVPTTETPR